MGANNPFAHDGFFQNSNSPPYSAGRTPNQQYFQGPDIPTNMMDYEGMGNQGFMTPDGFQSDMGAFNDAALSTNNHFSPVQVSVLWASLCGTSSTLHDAFQRT